MIEGKMIDGIAEYTHTSPPPTKVTNNPDGSHTVTFGDPEESRPLQFDPCWLPMFDTITEKNGDDFISLPQPRGARPYSSFRHAAEAMRQAGKDAIDKYRKEHPEITDFRKKKADKKVSIGSRFQGHAVKRDTVAGVYEEVLPAMTSSEELLQRALLKPKKKTIAVVWDYTEGTQW